MFLEVYAGIITVAAAALVVAMGIFQDSRDEALDKVDALRKKASDQWKEICELSNQKGLLNKSLRQAMDELDEIARLGPKLQVEHVNFDGVRVSRAVQIHHAGPVTPKVAIDEIIKQAVKMGYMQMFDLIAPFLEVKMGEEWEKVDRSPAKTVDPTSGATSQFVTVSVLIGKRR